MSVLQWVNSIAELDPALNTAIGSLAAAISMAIITVVSYYFPKDHSKFDEYEFFNNLEDEEFYISQKKKKKKNKRPKALENGEHE